MTGADLPLGCFGKLPFWPEYLELGVRFETSRALKEFLLSGRAELESQREESTPVTAARNMRFVIAHPGSVEVLVGVVRPSTDLGGLRHFPFSVFTHLPRRYYGKRYAMLPAGLDQTWELLEDVWRSLSEVASEGAYREMVEATRIPMPRPAGEARALFEAGLSAGVERLFRGHDGASAERLAAGMPELIQRLKHGKGNSHLALELPVSGTLEDACIDTSVWLELLGRQFWMQKIEPSFFLDASTGNEARSAVFLFGELDATDYPAVLAATGDGQELMRPALGTNRDPGASGWGSLAELSRWRIGK